MVRKKRGSAFDSNSTKI